MPIVLSISPIVTAAAPCGGNSSGPTSVGFSSGQTQYLTYTISSFASIPTGSSIVVYLSSPSGGWTWSVFSGGSTTYSSQSSISTVIEVTAPSGSVTPVSLTVTWTDTACTGNSAFDSTSTYFVAGSSTVLTAPEFGVSVAAVAAVALVGLALFRRTSLNKVKVPGSN